MPGLPSEATVSASLSVASVEKGEAGWVLMITKTDNFGRPYGEAQRFALHPDGSTIEDLNRGTVLNWKAPGGLADRMATAMAAMQEVLQALADAEAITT